MNIIRMKQYINSDSLIEKLSYMGYFDDDENEELYNLLEEFSDNIFKHFIWNIKYNIICSVIFNKIINIIYKDKLNG